MQINAMLKVALVAGMFLLTSHCLSVEAADWSQQIRSGKIVSEESINNDEYKNDINQILLNTKYKDLEVVGGDIAWVAPGKTGIRTIYFKANCVSKQGENVIVEGWTDYFNPKKYKITKVYRPSKK